MTPNLKVGRLRDQRGFTLVELLAVIGLTSILLTFGVGALRHYWLTHALEGAEDQIVSQMKLAQQRAGAESHPVVYGLAFTQNSSEWSLLRYDPRLPTGGTCHRSELADFEGGVVVEDVGDITKFISADTIRAECTTVGGRTYDPDDLVFFFARGSATPGKVVIRSNPTGETKTVEVKGVTGRPVSQ